MKKMLTAMSALCAPALFATVPVINQASVIVEQRGNRTVVISYDLNAATEGDAEPAIVTVDILTNAVGEAAASVGGEHLWTLSGDVNKIVQQGKRKILWSPHKEGMGEWTLPALQVQAVVTAWATNAPPAYWVIDCETPKDRSTDRYYPNAEQIPQTVTNILYKTEKIVFRRIASSGVTWRQGASTDDYASAQNYETPRYVTFSYDYYMGVFELTRGQYVRISRSPMIFAKTTDQSVKDAALASARPLTGNPNTFQPNGWDNGLTFDPSQSRIRQAINASNNQRGIWDMKRSFGLNVDIPTQAEFEYACRAGTTNLWVSGEGSFGDYAWYSGNSSTGPQDFHDVGLKLPNAWGIYDIQGNVWELGLDWSYRDRGRTSDPVWDYMGPAKDAKETYRIQYGGCVKSSKNDCRASFYGRIAPAQNTGMHANDANYTLGIRLVVIMQ